MTLWSMTICIDTPNCQTLHYLVILLHIPNCTLSPTFTSKFPNFESVYHLQRLWLVKRGHLHFRSHRPVSFVACMCSDVETGLSWMCHVSGLWISNIPWYFYFPVYEIVVRLGRCMTPGPTFLHLTIAMLI